MFHVEKWVAWLVYTGLVILMLECIVFRGGYLYPIRGRVHLRASVIRVSGRNGKAVLVDSKFTWELF
jgi:hypothetical protein